MRSLFSIVALGLVSSFAFANPARVASCFATARNTYALTGKQASTLCKKFKGNAVHTCYQQTKQLGLDPDLGATLCAEADTQAPIQCYGLVIQAGGTPAEASTACSGDKP